jgi:HTH-type transcriptional regulator/antitoxin HigA
MVKSLDPDWVIAPGETLREHLEEAGRSQADLARSAGWSTKFVCELAKGKASLTVTTALVLEEETGIPARLWLCLEADYQIGLRRGKEAL